MSNYIFSPSPNYGQSEHPFSTWENGFSDEEVSKILEYASSLELQNGTISGGEVDKDISDIRKSSVSWIEFNQDTGWLYDRLAYIARCLNGKFWNFDLYGFSEHMQFTVYEESVKGHYTWHLDNGVSNNGMAPRKLTIVLQLSDPSEYEGGDLELFTSKDPTQVKKEKGLIAAFPSYTLHRVTPVTKGVRKTLVVWITGPSFK